MSMTPAIRGSATSMIDSTGRGKGSEAEGAVPLRATPVEFAATDGAVLRGLRYGEGDGWVVLVHGEGHDLDAWKILVPELAALGLTVLAFDLRGHGASDDPWEPRLLPSDVLAALRLAGSEGARSLYLVGAGAGATAALVAAGEHEVQALVALSPHAELDGIPPDALRESTAPKLFIVGGADASAAAQASAVHRASIGWSVLGAPPVEAQGTDLLASDWAETVTEHVVVFLTDYL
jgi:pimeloyl-ACP methyl ester carboxylesterase